MVGVPPSRNETASRGTGRKGKGREIKRFTCSTTATRGFARFGLRSRGTRFIHGERKERETEERNGLARVVEDRGGAVGGIVFRRCDSIDPRGRRCRRGREGRSRLWNRGRGSTGCCARGTPGTINRFHAAVQWRRQLAPSTLI